MRSPRKKSAMTKATRRSRAPKPHAVPQFYGVYLLRSIPKPKSFYIGSTNDPERRLLQHNGHLKGGAFRTKVKGKQPWEMVLVVYGFMNKQTALMFEHSFQRCYQTRHIRPEERIVKSKTNSSLHQKLGSIKLLLKSPFFSNLGLKVQCFRQDVYNDWCTNKYGVPVSDAVRVGYVDEKQADFEVNKDHVIAFKNKLIDDDQETLRKYGDILSYGAHGCRICMKEVDYINDNSFPLVAICYHCDDLIHLGCLAKKVRNDQVGKDQRDLMTSQKASQRASQRTKQTAPDLTSTTLIPKKAQCPSCEKVLIWTNLVRTATRLKAKYGMSLETSLEDPVGADAAEEDDNPTQTFEAENNSGAELE